VQLFVERVTAVLEHFALTDANAPLVAKICRRLDGLPLAIEFAAPRVEALGIAGLAARLDDSLPLLEVRRRSASPRHHTMRAVIDWSYSLLNENEQLFFRSLAIFAGGFTVQAAAAVAVHAANTGIDVIDRLADLVAKSLVVADAIGAKPRFRLLDTTRAYAIEKLDESGERERVARNHALYFRDAFASPASGTGSGLSNDELARRVREIDNVRAALNWSFAPLGDVAIGVDLTAVYAPVWPHLSLMTECRERCESALIGFEASGISNTRAQMQLQLALGRALVATMAPAEQTKTILTKALELANGLGDLGAQASALRALQGVLVYRGEYGHARTVAEQLQQIAGRIGEPAIAAVADRLMGNTLLTLGRPREAQQCLERVLRSSVPAEDRQMMTSQQSDDRAMARAMLARALWLQGFAKKARSEAEASLEELQGTDYGLSFCRVLYFGFCRIVPMIGDFAAAERAITRLIEVAISLNAPFWQTAGRLLEGKLLVEREEFAQGAAVLRDALDTCSGTGWRISYPEFKGALAQALAGLGQVDGALSAVNEAVASAGQGKNGQVWYVPELLRIKGEVLLRQAEKRSAASAEDCFDQAGEMAHEQGALFWELRVALSLACLRMSQSRHDEARRALVPIYDRFTEGFGAADLIAAKQLLDALDSAGSD
jgi:predicted ATPase